MHFGSPLRHPILRIAYRKARLIPDARHPNAPARHRPPGPAPAVARALSAAARVGRARHRAGALGHAAGRQRRIDGPDRKSVVEGRRVSVRGDLGGRRITKIKILLETTFYS